MTLQPRRVELDGARFEYLFKPGRSGIPVVLLHPWFGCWQFWQQTLASLPDRPCYVGDLYSPGKGEWGVLASPEGLAEAVIALLDAERITRCVLVGNSMGGIVAQVVAATSPERIDKLVLVGTGATTAGLKPDYRAEIDAWLGSDPDGSRAERFVARLFARTPPPDELAVYVGAIRAANRDFMAAALMNALELDLRPRLPSITARTLVVRGELDAGRTREHVEQLLRGIPDSEAIEVPGGGHSVMVDSAAEFVRVLQEFLEHGHVQGATRETSGR